MMKRNMSKHTYITPSIEIVNVEPVAMISNSVLGISDDIKINTSDLDAQLGRDRRGTWGNLWDDGE